MINCKMLSRQVVGVISCTFLSSLVYAGSECTMHEEEDPGTGNYSLTFTDMSCLDNYVQQQTASISRSVADNYQKIVENKTANGTNTDNIAANKTTIGTNASNITANKTDVDANYLTTKAIYKILASIPGMTEFVYTGSCGDQNHRISIAPVSFGNAPNRMVSSSYIPIDPHSPTFVYMNKKSSDETSTQGIAITTSADTNIGEENSWDQITIRRRGDLLWDPRTNFGGPGNYIFPIGSFDLCNHDGCHTSGWPLTSVDGGITNQSEDNSWVRATLKPADGAHPWGYFEVTCW